MDDLDLLPDEDLAEDGEGGEDRGEGGAAVDDPVWQVVDFEAVGEIANSCAARVGVGDDYYFVAAVDEFLRVEELDGL